MTDPKELSEKEQAVWNHLSDGEKEQAAWAFDRLDEAEQGELVGKLDEFDRKDLVEGFEQIIERQPGPSVQEEQSAQKDQESQEEENVQEKGSSQAEGWSHGHGLGR